MPIQFDPNSPRRILWVSVADLSTMGAIAGVCSPLMFMIHEEFGDELLPQAVYAGDMVDDQYLLISCTQERAEAIVPALELLGQKKIGRKVRTRVTANMPQPPKWRVTSPDALSRI